MHDSFPSPEGAALGDILWGSEVHRVSTVGGTCPPVGQRLLLCSLVGRAGT